MYVTIYQRQKVPLPNEKEYIKNEFEHLVVVYEGAKEDWSQTIIDYISYEKLPKNPKRKTYICRCVPRFLLFKDTLKEHYLRVYYYDVWRGRNNASFTKSPIKSVQIT